MLQDRVEPDWLAAFELVLRRCAVAPGDTVAVLSESQSRPILVQLAQLAAGRVGARSFGLCVPTPFTRGAPQARSRAPPMLCKT